MGRQDPSLFKFVRSFLLFKGCLKFFFFLISHIFPIFFSIKILFYCKTILNTKRTDQTFVLQANSTRKTKNFSFFI